MSFKTCEYCGKPFLVSRDHLRYCSTECFKLARKKYKHQHYLRNKQRYNSRKIKKVSEQRRQKRIQKSIDHLMRKKQLQELGLTAEQIQKRNEILENQWIPADLYDFDTSLEEILIRNNNMINTLEEKFLNEIGKTNDE